MGFTKLDKNTTLKEFNNGINNPKVPRQHTRLKPSQTRSKGQGEMSNKLLKNTKTMGINKKFDRTTENSNVFSNVSFLSRLDFQEY